MDRRRFLKLGMMAMGASDLLRTKLEAMTDEELLALSPLRAQQERSPRPSSPMALGALVWGDRWQTAPHLELLNSWLVAVGQKRCRRLLITMPPRHGKSLLTSEMFPAWYAGMYPDRRIILASYEADFASSWGRKARNILEEHGHKRFGVRVSGTSSAADRWDIKGRRGGMNTAGVGGAITGKGADLLIIDDPVKNSAEANSFTYRQKTWEWYQSTAYTRLEPDGAIILIQTRWHSDDLAGRILREAESGEKWEVLNLPAIARHDDQIGREPGEPLWPARFNVERLDEIRRVVGEYTWSALYDQNPASDEGSKIKREWFRHFDKQGAYYRLYSAENKMFKVVEPSECQRFITVDCAGSSDDIAKEKRGKTASHSVISVFDFHRPTGYLIWRDMRRGRWEFPELCGQVKRAYDDHQPAWVGVEDEKTGRAVLQYLRALPMRPLSHECKGKVERFGTAANELMAGKVFTPRTASLGWDRSIWEAEAIAWTGHPDEPFDIGDTLGYAARHADREHASTTLQGGLVKVTGRF